MILVVLVNGTRKASIFLEYLSSMWLQA